MVESRKNPDVEDLSLGIDVGSATIGYVLVNREADLIESRYVTHRGDIHGSLHRLLQDLPPGRIGYIGVNPQGRAFLRTGVPVNDQVALIEGVRHHDPACRDILHVGAEQFGLIQLDKDGRYRRYISNTGCAAGTGSFLDQQAGRLGLNGSAELSALALRFEGTPPRIATRCAVFAKTDLIHAQQKGHRVEAICAGLCEGVARNILDTVTRGSDITGPCVMTGGVALNGKVVEYIRMLSGVSFRPVPHPALMPAFGMALVALRTGESVPSIRTPSDLVAEKPAERRYYYSPLADEPFHMEPVPLFRRFIYEDVETEIFTRPVRDREVPVALGIDIGSTSTKAALMGPDAVMIAGFYTRTRGQPIRAVQRIMRGIRDIGDQYGIRFRIQSAGTTGSGRKFIHHVLHSDRAIDEISAHARAAVHLNPDVDTIIEIGGQDSKFTMMDQGRIVFSVMNYVCAAGTGSFLEEQAERLGVSLDAYNESAEKARAPLTSDRCTVFMERDLNQLLHLGFKKEELLAAALHSVRDNYLTKVAHMHKIGQVIAFQGATARNRGLVKAFERKLGRPILVSPYCHLTGAMGVCLILMDQNVELNRRFRTNFDQDEIHISEITCQDCPNHCKLNHIRVAGEELTWGHLCGKDEGAGPLKPENMGLIDRREKILADPAMPARTGIHIPHGISISVPDLSESVEKARQAVGRLQKQLDLKIPRLKLFRPEPSGREQPDETFCIGLPNTLYFMDSLPLWRKFFTDLGCKVRLSGTKADTLETGRRISGAEFCSPMSLLHGHARALLERCDFLFMPVILQQWTSGTSKSYCYYSNYAVSLIQNNPQLNCADRIMAPLLLTGDSAERQAHLIHESMPRIMRDRFPAEEIRTVLKRSILWFREKQRILRKTTEEAISGLDDTGVILLGRPYIVLDDRVNNRLLHRLAAMDLPLVYQDMLAYDGRHIEAGRDIVSWNHWFYGDMILRTAENIARSPFLFPIYMTAFKCAPDAFLIPYFRNVMDQSGKPYLILQLDEHHGVEGYDTRLEAAVETFRNHRRRESSTQNVTVTVKRHIEKKTYLLPNYDPLSTLLVSAAFRRHGINALPIIETEETVKASVRLNDGQCLPVSAIVQAIAHTVHTCGLVPEHTAVFINAISQLSCNFPQYPVFIRQLMERIGGGLEKMDVFATTPSMTGLPVAVLIDVYTGYLLGGLLQRMACRIRPREAFTGSVEEILGEGVADLARAIEKHGDREKVFRNLVTRFERVPRRPDRLELPRVAIIGDLYVRDNHIFNQNLIQEIEQSGAEVITTPYNYMVRLMASKYFRNLVSRREYLTLTFQKTLLSAMGRFDRRFFNIAAPVLQDKMPDFSAGFLRHLDAYHLTLKHDGESSQNVMKIFFLLKHYPDIRLFVHVNPVFCCPALVSESLFKRIEKDTGVPVVSITYDGTQTPHNRVLIPYLHYLGETEGAKANTSRTV